MQAERLYGVQVLERTKFVLLIWHALDLHAILSLAWNMKACKLWCKEEVPATPPSRRDYRENTDYKYDGFFCEIWPAKWMDIVKMTNERHHFVHSSITLLKYTQDTKYF